MKNYKILTFFLALCFLVAVSGHWATAQSVHNWYLTLKKASWNPPAWVFPPVWTLLYILIAVAGSQIFVAKKSKRRSKALFFYAAQLLFNGLWSFLFFYWQNPLLGLLDIAALLSTIGLTIYFARPIAKTAAFLLLPYLIWVLYAATLNGAIVYFTETV